MDESALSRLTGKERAALAHELRNPLNAIVNWADLLLMQPQGEDVTQGLKAIARSARQLSQLLDQLDADKS